MEKFSEQVQSLKDDLQEFLNDAEKILGYKVELYYKVVEDLLAFNTKESIVLANDIFETQNDINILENYREEFILNDPFNTLQNEDEDD